MTASAIAPLAAKSSRRNRLVAGIVALSMIAGSVTPAQADRRGDDLAKALVAALAVGLAINAINNNSHKKPKPQPAPKPTPQPIYQPRVPASCAIELDSSQYGMVSMYPERCLRNQGFNYQLPDCGRAIRIYGQPDWVYSGQCLREAGFRVDR